MFSNLFSWKWCRLRGNVEKYSRARLATDDNIGRCMHFACRIINAKDTPRMCNIYCFSTAIMVRRKAPQFYFSTYIACLAKLLHVHVYFVVMVHIGHATRFSTRRSRYSRQRSVDFFFTSVPVRSQFWTNAHTCKSSWTCFLAIISNFWETVF
jgi:hypothetical protein